MLRVAYMLLIVGFGAMAAAELVTLTALEFRSPIMFCPAMRPDSPMVFVPEWIPDALMTVAASMTLAVTIAQSWLRMVRVEPS